MGKLTAQNAKDLLSTHPGDYATKEARIGWGERSEPQQKQAK
jgi:hypothetical protein